MNIYKEFGFDSRKEYLQDLAATNDVSEEDVFALADLLGETEDFDGLVTGLEDYSRMK